MPVCTKCKIDVPVDKFDTYWHSTKQKHFTRRICNPCMRIGYRQYKMRIKEQKRLLEELPKEEKIIQTVVLELEPEVFTIPDNHKQCSDCMEYQPLDNYYLNRYGNHIKRCKSCHVKLNREKVRDKIEMNGGADSYYKEPNRYWDEEQKKNVFMVMEALGWIFDEPTGIWNKFGIKENGVFINMVLENKPKKKPSIGGGRKIKKGVWNSVDKIVKLIEEGYTYDDVAETFCCSHTLIRLVISKYRNGEVTY
jgi:hypothetical protein